MRISLYLAEKALLPSRYSYLFLSDELNPDALPEDLRTTAGDLTFIRQIDVTDADYRTGAHTKKDILYDIHDHGYSLQGRPW